MKSIAQAQVVASLRARLERLTPTNDAKWGKMNPHQMLIHVANAMDRVTSGEAFPSFGKGPSRLTKILGLKIPLPWPKGLPSTHEPASLEVDKSAFDAERDRTLSLLDSMANADGSGFTAVHPVFGAMSAKDWYRWAYLHLDHHLRQFGL